MVIFCCSLSLFGNIVKEFIVEAPKENNKRNSNITVMSVDIKLFAVVVSWYLETLEHLYKIPPFRSGGEQGFI